ncbi:site-2 protease family protein, partial [Streptococcus suis]|uniref:site-2 protease family protein n=1 Tax=Streptococcus suis TaxID=1307 RepID=UPI0029C25251
QLGFVVFASFVASMSATLGALNLLPIPALDGGHLMYHLFEWVTGRPIPEVWLERLQRGGLALLLVMMSLAHYNDVVRYWFHP